MLDNSTHIKQNMLTFYEVLLIKNQRKTYKTLFQATSIEIRYARYEIFQNWKFENCT